MSTKCALSAFGKRACLGSLLCVGLVIASCGITPAGASGSTTAAPAVPRSSTVNPAVPPGGSPLPSAAPRGRRYTVAVMGDSLTAERGKFKSYVTRLQSLCPQSRFDNYGIGGQMTNQMRRRFGRDVLGQEKPAPDTTGPATPRYTDVLIFGGVNDLYSDLTAHRTNERIQADLAQMYRSAKQAGLRTIALTVAPWGGFKKYFTAARASHTRELNQWIGGQAAPKSSPPLLDVVVETGSLLSCGNPDELCPNHVPPFNDGLHFGAAAHQILAQAIAQAAFPDCE